MVYWNQIKTSINNLSSNYNTINNSIGAGTSTSAGVSIQHTQSFNEIKDLWKRERAKKEKSMNDDAMKQEDENL